MRRRKISKAEKQKRVAEVQLWIMEGHGNNQMFEKFKEKYGHDYNERTFRDYLSAASEKIQEFFEPKVEEYTAKYIARLEALYDLNMQSFDYKEARNALNDLHETIVGKTKKMQVDHTTGGKPLQSAIQIEIVDPTDD